MTRNELLTDLTAWSPPTAWSGETIANRDRLQFALWWYGRSTEAAKCDPQWPDDDYVAHKTGGGPRYLDSIDDAIGLVPPGLYWLIGAGKTRPAEPLFGAQIIDPASGAVIAEAEGDVTAAHTICIAALKARMAGSIGH